jgi:hypothetical protein
MRADSESNALGMAPCPVNTSLRSEVARAFAEVVFQEDFVRRSTL